MRGDEPRRTRLRWNPRYSNPFFAGLVVIAGEFHPIPFRTRPLKPPAPMVLRVNTRESRSPPGLQRTDHTNPAIHIPTKSPVLTRGAFCLTRSLLQIAWRVLVQQQRRGRWFGENETRHEIAQLAHIFAA